MGLWLKQGDELVPVASGGGGGSFDGDHVLTGDPLNPPAELQVGQLLWDGVEGTGGGGLSLLGRERYEAGSHTFSIGDYPGAKEIHVRMTGGGAGGGGCMGVDGSNVSVGSGGGAAGSAEFIVKVDSLSASEPITVGAGGAGGLGDAAGSDGADTTGFGWTMGGGSGGLHMAGANPDYRAMRGGVGGGMTAGLGTHLNSSSGGWGGPTQAWAIQRPVGGFGGDSLLGVGGHGGNGTTNSGTNGGQAKGPGAGGGGAVNRPGQGSQRAGGRGADGVVLIEVWG